MPAPTTAIESFLFRIAFTESRSLLFNTGLLDHAGPFRHVRFQEGHQFLRRARLRHHAEIEEAGLDVGHREHFGERLVEGGDHFRSRALRGVKGYEVTSWNGMFAPKGTRPEVIATLNKTLAEVLARPDMPSRSLHLGVATRWSALA